MYVGRNYYLGGTWEPAYLPRHLPCLALLLCLCHSRHPTLAADTATAPSATVASSGSQNPFADVPANSWAYQAIDQLHADGLIEGYPDGYFKGNRPLTRYEIAVLTQRVADKLEADLADASKAAKVNSDDIVLVRRLLDTYGADLAEVKQNLARTQHQTEENTKQLERAQIHVGYILRPGEYSQRSVIVNNATGLEVANGSTPSAGPIVNPAGANPYTDGHTTPRYRLSDLTSRLNRTDRSQNIV